MEALEQLTWSDGSARYPIKDGIVYGSYVTGWGSLPPCIKNPSISVGEDGKTVWISAALLRYGDVGPEWSFYDPAEINYPIALVLCRLNIGMEKTENGYRYVSLECSPAFVRN